MTSTVLVDSSAVISYVLRQPGYATIERFLDAANLRVVIPDPALTEVIYVSRREGNTTSPWDFPTLLAGLGFEQVGLEAADLVVAAELHEMSQAHPLPATRPGAQPSTLSLADALILAVAERLTKAGKVVVVTRDQYWQWLADQQLLSSVVKAF